MNLLKKLLNWLKGNKKIDVDPTYEEEPIVNINPVEEVEPDHVCTCGEECKCEECHCEETTCEKELPQTEDPDYKFLVGLNWDMLSFEPENVCKLVKIDLTNFCDDIINWYAISKVKGLPDEFICKYKDKIIWSEYNKCYLKKATKEMLKAEGYIK